MPLQLSDLPPISPRAFNRSPLIPPSSPNLPRWGDLLLQLSDLAGLCAAVPPPAPAAHLGPPAAPGGFSAPPPVAGSASDAAAAYAAATEQLRAQLQPLLELVDQLWVAVGTAGVSDDVRTEVKKRTFDGLPPTSRGLPRPSTRRYARRCSAAASSSSSASTRLAATRTLRTICPS